MMALSNEWANNGVFYDVRIQNSENSGDTLLNS